MSSTLYLDPGTWDLAVDASGSIAVATNPYQLAQDAASAISTFLGEVYYDPTIGVSYFQSIFTGVPTLTLVKAQLKAAALTVPGVVDAQVFIIDFAARVVSGQVQVTDQAGNAAFANF